MTNKLETCGLRHLNRSKCLSPFASHASKALETKCLRFCPRCEHGGEADREKKVLMVDMTDGRGGGGVVVVGGEEGEGERSVGGMDVDG